MTLPTMRRNDEAPDRAKPVTMCDWLCSLLVQEWSGQGPYLRGGIVSAPGEREAARLATGEAQMVFAIDQLPRQSIGPALCCARIATLHAGSSAICREAFTCIL